jgi:hypothetical protein
MHLPTIAQQSVVAVIMELTYHCCLMFCVVASVCAAAGALFIAQLPLCLLLLSWFAPQYITAFCCHSIQENTELDMWGPPSRKEDGLLEEGLYKKMLSYT